MHVIGFDLGAHVAHVAGKWFTDIGHYNMSNLDQEIDRLNYYRKYFGRITGKKLLNSEFKLQRKLARNRRKASNCLLRFSEIR